MTLQITVSAVLSLADKLNDEGVNCDVDQYHEGDPPAKGWSGWMMDAIEQADFVLVVCTKSYDDRFRRRDNTPKGKGAKWEGAIITQQLYESLEGNKKFLPVVFNQGDLEHIPLPLKPTSYYSLSGDYESLYRRLTGQPRIVKPKVGEIRQLSTRLSSARREAAPKIEPARAPSEIPKRGITGSAGALSPDIENSVNKSIQLANYAATGLVDAPHVFAQVIATSAAPPPMSHGASRKAAIDGISRLFSTHTWVAIHGDGGSGKTQLVARFVSANRKPCVWIRLKGLDARLSQMVIRSAIEQRSERPTDPFPLQCQALTAQLGTGSLIVLDDIPQLNSGDMLIEDIAGIVGASGTDGVRLLTTSLHTLPAATEAMIGQAVKQLESPRFSSTEAIELLQGQGAPPELLTEKRAEVFVAIAKGHPLLLVGIAHYLAAHNWRFSSEELNGLFRGAHTTFIVGEVLARLISTITPDAREFVYRLNLVTGSFTRAEAIALANVPPQIPRPTELLHSLMGYCLQEDGIDRFVVSPPVGAIGSDDIGAETRRQCHGVIAHAIVSSRKLNPWTAGDAIVHLVHSGELNRAGALLLNGLHSINQLKRSKVTGSDFLLNFWVTTPLPEGIDLEMHLSIRGLQIAIRSRSGESIKFLQEDLETLVDSATPGDEVGVFMGVMNALPAIGKTSPEIALKLISRVVDTLPQLDRNLKTRGIRLQSDISPEYIIWMGVGYVQKAAGLRVWTETLKKLTPQQVEQLKKGDTDGSFAMSVATGPWLDESRLPKSDQSWLELEQEYTNAANTAKSLHLDLLWANFIRSVIIIRSEYRSDLDGAIAIGTSALALAGDDPTVEFLLCEAIGRQYHFKDRQSEALPWLKRAISSTTPHYSMTRVYDFIYASNAAGLVDSAEGARFAEQSLETIRAMPAREWSSQAAQYESAKLLGEIGLARWLDGDLHGAYLALKTAVETLYRINDRTEEWKEIFVLLGYVFRYLAVLARDGEAPDLNQYGEEYLKPYRGVLLSINAERASLHSTEKEKILYVQLAMFATAVGEYDDAVAWARKGIKEVRNDGPSVLVDTLAWYIVAEEVRLKQFDEAIRRGFDAVRHTAARHALESKGVDTFAVHYDPEKLVDAMDPKFLDSGYRNATLALIIAISCRLFGIKVSSPEELPSTLKAAVSACRRQVERGILGDTWAECEKVFNAILDDNTRPGELIRMANELEDRHSAVRVAGYIGASMKEIGDVERAAAVQLAVFPLVHAALKSFWGMYRIPIEMLTHYWPDRLQNSAFLFGAPGALKESLERAIELSELERAQAILSAVAQSLGIRVDPRVQDWFKGGS